MASLSLNNPAKKSRKADAEFISSPSYTTPAMLPYSMDHCTLFVPVKAKTDSKV